MFPVDICEKLLKANIVKLYGTFTVPDLLVDVDSIVLTSYGTDGTCDVYGTLVKTKEFKGVLTGDIASVLAVEYRRVIHTLVINIATEIGTIGYATHKESYYMDGGYEYDGETENLVGTIKKIEVIA